MPAEIPPDQLERIQPVVASVLDQVHQLALDLADDADSALVFEPQGGDRS